MPRVLSGRSSIRLCLCLAFLAILTSVPRAANPLFVPVQWQTMVNVTTTSGAVTKTSGCDGCQDGSVMSAPLPTSGDVYVRFVPNATGTMVVGLIQDGTTLSASAFALGFQLSADGFWEVRESGVWVAEGMAGPTDEFRIGLEGDQVRYYVSGHVVYSRNRPPATSYRLAAIFSAMGAGLADTAVGTTSVTSQPSYAPVLWTDAANLTVGGSTVTKTSGCDGCPDAFAVSGSQTGSQDAYLEFPAVVDKRIVVGFIPAGEGVSLGAIDYGVGFYPDGGWDVREGDGYRIDGSTGQGDIFRIALEGTHVTYYRNGFAIWTAARRDGISYRAVVLDYSSGGTLGGADLAINSAPVISAPGTPHFALSTLGSMAIGASDPEHDVMTFSAFGLPTGLSLNPYSGIIAGTPTSAGQSAVSVTVADLHGGTNTISFTLVVDNTSPASIPTLASVSPSTAARGTDVTLTGTNFGAQANGAYVWLGTVPGTVVSWSATQIVARVDPDSTSGIAQVRLPTGTSNAVDFIVGGAPPCTFSVSPLELLVPASGQTGTLIVTTSPSCAWTATSDAPWISLTSGSGSGNASVSYQIAENISTSARSSNVLLAGKVVHITQAAAPERTGPVTITAHASPAANAVGWNNTDVTVTFSCTNATVCPQAMLVSAETAAQVLTGTASNADHSATVSVTVKVDKTAPTLTLSAPASIPAGIVSMSGTVAESLSGLASTSCNGAGVTASNGSITCVVPITYGNNSMALQATDLAGNVASIGGHVFGTGTPTSLRISPPTRTLLVGESIGIQVLDDAGITPPSLTWSVADQAVASVNSGTVTATSAGTTTITAAAGGLSAQLTITVVNGASLPVGTARWTTQASPGSDSVGVVGVLGIDESTVLASVESVWDSSIGDWGGYSHSIVRGLSESGEATFSINPGLASNEVPTRIVGDSTGGLLMLVLKYPTTQAEYDYDALQGGHPVSLVRVSPVPDSIWRYPLGRAASGTDYTMAEGDDGTIYIVGDRGTQLVAVDRQTGATRFRRAAPLQVFHYYSDTCPQLNFDTSGYNPALWPFSEPRVDANGVVNTLVVSREGSVPILVSQNGSCQITGYGQSQFTQTVSLHRVSSDGTAQVIALGQYSDHGITTTSGEGGYVLPDDTGGVLTSWLVCSVPAPNQQQCQRRARHVSPAGLGAEFDLTEIPSISGTDSVAYDSAGAISMVTGLRLWSKIPSTPVAALENGETQYGSYGAATAVFDASGNVLRSDQSLSFDVDGPTLIRGNMQFGWTPDHSAFTALVADERYIDPDGGFQTRQGNARKTNSRVSCVPKPAWWSNALTTPRDYQFAFDDEIPGFPTAASFGIFFATERSFFLPEFVKWQFGGDRGFPNAITRLTSGTSAANLVVSAGDFLSVPPSRVNLYSAAAVTLFPASMYPTTSLSADYRSAAAVGAFPSNRFGIIVQKDYATATDAAHASYLKFVALHEFGHVIGLGHSEQVCRPSRAAMTQRARSLTDHVTAPTELDKKALRKQLKI